MTLRNTGDMEQSITRRRFLIAAGGLSATGFLAGCQRAQRVQRVEPDPGSGFHHPYYLATPESYRAGPVPVLVEANNADETRSREEELKIAKNQSRVLSFQGAWLSEMLGVPHLKTAFREPAGDASTEQIESVQLDRTAMQLEDTDLARLDLQTLRMVEHAKETVLADQIEGVAASSLDDQFIMYGNSSEAQFAYRVALMHPEETLAIACSAVNGTVVLPLERLADRSLKYEVGIADFESLVGNPFDPEAFDEVNKFLIQGGEDPKRRLLMDKEEALRRNAWDDEQIYETARIVFGPRMVEDRLPRCHIAFDKADVSGQFRVYPEMPHGDRQALHDIFEFFDRSIEGEDVSDFGQRLRLPFDRTITLQQTNPGVGDELQFGISGLFPPPEGLVTYEWHVDDGRSSSGPAASFTFDESGEYDITLGIETAHGQSGRLGISLLGDGSSFAAFQYAVDAPEPRYLAEGREFLVDESATFGVDVANIGAVPGQRRLEFIVGGEMMASREVQLNPSNSTTITFEHSFGKEGEVEVHIPPAFRETMTVTR